MAKGDAVKILFATFKSAEDFLGRLSIGGESGVGRVRVATKARYNPGEAVVLEIGFPGLPNRVLIRTTATRASEAAREASFDLCEGEDHKRDFLVAVASGRAQASWKRKNRRFPMRLKAKVAAEGDKDHFSEAKTDDVGPGGVFLKTDKPLPEGARVSVLLDPADGSDAMEFTGRVTFSRDDDAAGIGVQFDRLHNDEMKRLRRLIRDVKIQGKLVEWGDT